MAFDKLLIHQIYLQTATSSQNAFGEWTKSSWTSATTPIDCRLVYAKSEDIISEFGTYQDIEYKCYCKPTESIETSNRVYYSGNSYTIRGIKNDSSNHHKKIYLERVNG